MAVTIDIGNPDDVHPTDKATVGHRLALTARAITYGEQLNTPDHCFRQATPEGAGNTGVVRSRVRIDDQ